MRLGVQFQRQYRWAAADRSGPGAGRPFFVRRGKWLTRRRFLDLSPDSPTVFVESGGARQAEAPGRRAPAECFDDILRA